MTIRSLPAVIFAAVLLSGCSPPAPTATTLAALSAAQKDFNGQSVEVSGILRTFDSPRHYWIENESLDRVAIRGAEDPAALVGQRVTVTGTFHYSQDSGRRIEVEAMAMVPGE